MENRSRAPKRRTIEVAVVPHQGQHHMNEDDKRRKVTISSIINLVPNPKELLDVRVFMPNRTHIDFQMQRGQIFGIRIRSLVERIQMEVREQEDKFSRPKQRSICWGSHLTIEDFEGNIIDDKNSTHLIKESRRSVLLMLQDGHPDSKHAYPDLWNVTPEAHVLEVLPQEYTLFSALADEIDNSLQAVWALEKGKRRLISVTLEEKKITIFDTGEGMDSSPKHSIAKWGTLGSSSSRCSVQKGVGGEPPYLKPYFGMYGFGGIGAGLHLGGSITVSSKTARSRIVAVLHLRGESLKNEVESGSIWKTPGEIRKPTEEELGLSAHGSFTKVEISDLNCTASKWKVADVQRKLKDFYTPYIQNDESTGSSSITTRPVEILVNGMDLAEVLGGEVTTTNRFTGVGDPYVLLLEFSKGPAQIKNSEREKFGSERANARITCHYFPINKGKESLEQVLEVLRVEDPENFAEETFDGFSRVAIRRLGRLLPDARTKRIPFMDRRKGPRVNDLSKEAFKRVKAFIDLDAGFVPTQSKMDLLVNAKQTFTEALLNLGDPASTTKSLKARGGVSVVVKAKKSAAEDFETIQLDQLRSHYADWVQRMHRQFDVGATFDENSSNFIITSDEHRKEPLNITSDAFLVQYDIKCRDIKWVLGGKRQRPVRLKLRKGLPGLNGEYQTYVTVECIIRNDYPENPKSPGDTKLICRPIDVPPEMGSKLIRGHELNFILGKSRVFPIDILFCTEKFEDISENEPLWQKQLRKLQDSSPSHVELLSEVEALRFDTEGEIVDNCLLRAGESLPLEVIAVVRPRMSKVALQKGMNSGKSISGSRTDQKSIVARSSEMVLIVTELKFRPPGERVPPTEKGKEVYISPRSIKATTCCNVSGLYRFKPSQVSDLIMKKTGTYMLTLKILGEDFKDTKPLVIRVNVAASEKGDCWRVCNHAGDCNTAHPGLKSPNLWGRLGEALNWELFLCTYDDYNNPTKFRNINELKNINLELRTLAGECLNDIQLTLPRNFDIKNHISPDHCSLKLQKLELSGGNLATFAPTYQASLWIYIAKKRVAEFRFTVRPGSVGKAVMKEGETPARPLRPGQIIDHLVFQFMDKYGNLAEKGEVVDLALEGLKLCDRKGGSTRKVDDSSCVDLGGRLKVEARYGDTAAVELRNTTFGRTQVLGEFNFDIMKRQLRILNNPKSASGGSKLEDVTIEVVDVETGRVDEDMDGVTYALALGWNKAVCIPLKRGRCTLPDIILPNKTELWTGKVFLAEHPEIRVVMRVEILETWVLPAMENTSEYPPISRIALASLPPQELAKVLEASIERHKELEKKAKQKGRQVGLMESELEERKKRLKMFGEKQAYLHNQLRSLQKNEQDEDGGDSEYIEQAEMEEDKLETYNSKKLMSELQKLGDPPGTHAASVLLDAIVDDHRLVEGIGKDVIGLVAILAEVESDSISTALANFLGEDTMTCIICKTVLGIQFLGAHYVGHQSLGLHGLIKDRNSSISGSFGVILADPCSSYKRDDGEQAVIDDHPQKLLHLSPSADSTRPKPLGFIDYAVNLLQFHKGYTLCLKVGEFGLRETLFFNLFGYLQVYDTVENMMRAKEYIQTSAVSLDGGVLYDKRTLHFKTILGKSPTIRFAVASKTEIVDAPQRQPPPARLKLMQEIKKTSNQAAEECSKISVLLKELMQSKNRANQLTQDLTKEAAFTAGLVAKVKENHC